MADPGSRAGDSGRAAALPGEAHVSLQRAKSCCKNEVEDEFPRPGMKKRPIIPRLDGGQQTILLVEDVERSVAFYRDNIRLEVQDGDTDRYAEVDTGEGGMLLLVKSDGSIAPMASVAAVGTPSTLTFSITADGYEAWKKWLTRREVVIERETRWVHGGRSLYVRDPDGRRLEFKTPATVVPPPPTQLKPPSAGEK